MEMLPGEHMPLENATLFQIYNVFGVSNCKPHLQVNQLCNAKDNNSNEREKKQPKSRQNCLVIPAET